MCTSTNSILVPDGAALAGRQRLPGRASVVGNETLVDGDGRYNNLLPNLDFDVGLSRIR